VTGLLLQQQFDLHRQSQSQDDVLMAGTLAATAGDTSGATAAAGTGVLDANQQLLVHSRHLLQVQQQQQQQQQEVGAMAACPASPSVEGLQTMPRGQVQLMLSKLQPAALQQLLELQRHQPMLARVVMKRVLQQLQGTQAQQQQQQQQQQESGSISQGLSPIDRPAAAAAGGAAAAAAGGGGGGATSAATGTLPAQQSTSGQHGMFKHRNGSRMHEGGGTGVHQGQQQKRRPLVFPATATHAPYKPAMPDCWAWPTTASLAEAAWMVVLVRTSWHSSSRPCWQQQWQAQAVAALPPLPQPPPQAALGTAGSPAKSPASQW